MLFPFSSRLLVGQPFCLNCKSIPKCLAPGPLAACWLAQTFPTQAFQYLEKTPRGSWSARAGMCHLLKGAVLALVPGQPSLSPRQGSRHIKSTGSLCCVVRDSEYWGNWLGGGFLGLETAFKAM